MNFKSLTVRAVALSAVLIPALLPNLAKAQSVSPWLPIPGSGTISLGYIDQSADSAYIGDKKLPVAGITGGAASKYKRSSYGVNFNYGLSDSLSIDGTLSHGKVKVGAADNSSGLLDTVIGLNWRVVDEYEKRNAPTVTLRLTGILKGNYDGAKLAALGKDANGFGLNAIVGRQFTSTLRAWGGVGYENRSSGVPDAISFDANVGFRVIPALDLTAGYVSKKYNGKLDIGGAGFTPAAFQQVKEQRQVLKIGASYAIAGNQSIGVSLGKVVDGRNTVNDKSILGINYSYGF
jgi:hypothetical protein